MKENKKGIGLKFALAGIKAAFLYERNFRYHIFAMITVIIISYLIKLNQIEWLFIIISIFLVLVTELINSNMERLIDYIKPEHHPEAKIIKDIAAGTVLLAAILAIIVGFIIFIPKLISLSFI